MSSILRTTLQLQDPPRPRAKLKVARVKVDDGRYTGHDVWTVPYACTSIEVCGLVAVLKLNRKIVWQGKHLAMEIETLATRREVH